MRSGDGGWYVSKLKYSLWKADRGGKFEKKLTAGQLVTGSGQGEGLRLEGEGDGERYRAGRAAERRRR